jgi:predicted Zn-dependent peptidase
VAKRKRPAPSALSGGVALTTLPSGLRIASEHMPDVRSVSVGYWVDAGSRDERDEVAGASHFLEHLLFKGTTRRTAQQIAAQIDEVGGDLNAFTSKEYTCFHARCLDRDLRLAVDVLGDMITSALIRPADVDGERNVVLEEIRMHYDTPDDLVHSVFSEAWFGAHPLGREVLGDLDTITNMRRDQVNGYFRRKYAPENIVVAAAGNVRHDDFVDAVLDTLDGWTGPAKPSRPSRKPPGAAPAELLVARKRPTEQAHLVLGGAGLSRADERRFAAGVLNQALGGGMASRLFQEVREKRGLAYSVYSYHGMHNDTGNFAVYAGTAPQTAMEVLEVVLEELDKVCADGLTGEELTRAKGHMAGALVLGLEDSGSRMNRLGKSLLTGTPVLSLDETIAAVEAVTSEQVLGVARTLLGGPKALALVGPFGAAERKAFARRLQAA